MTKLQMILTANIARAEAAHRTAQVSERYGQAAYNQGRRDAYRDVLNSSKELGPAACDPVVPSEEPVAKPRTEDGGEILDPSVLDKQRERREAKADAEATETSAS